MCIRDIITEQERKKRKREQVKSNYLPGNKALSKRRHKRSSTVLSVFLTIARTISSASFFIADPLRKVKRIGSITFSIDFNVLLNL